MKERAGDELVWVHNRNFVSVNHAHVDVNVVGLAAGGAAARIGTLVGALPSVDADVCAQVEVQSKALFAVRTLERSLSGVALHVTG